MGVQVPSPAPELNPFGTFLNVIYIELMRDHKFFCDIAPSSRKDGVFYVEYYN